METRRIRATPTPKKRAFGTALPTNSPFPHQRQQQQQQPPKSAKKQLQWSDKKQSTSSTTTTISEVQSSRRQRSSRNNNNNDQSSIGHGGLVSTPYNTKTPTNVIREGTPSVKFTIHEDTRSTTLQRSSKKATTPGRVNLFHDFNSPTIPSNVATPGVIRQFDTPHTKKLTYANIAASSPKPKHGSTNTTPEQSAAAATSADHQSYLPKTPPTSLLLSVNTPSAASILSPSSTSSIKSNSTTGTSLAVNATSTDVPETIIAPSEYVIEFPPGPLQLKFDPVVYTLGKPMGCCVAQILPEFNTDLTCIRMGSAGETTHDGAAATMIQVNDLIISINGTNVLSRKFDVITDLLHRIDGSYKTIVFRSIERVWKSQFQRKTMRNLRNGRRVATALSNGQMERDLHSWVETPTKVEVGSRGGGGDRRNNVAIGDKLESITETSSSCEAQTPKGDTGSRLSMDLFSPSNVKKVMSQRSSSIELVLATTPKVSPRDDVMVDTEKKSNITTLQGSSGKASIKSPINQISKVLIGGDNSEQEFERSLRLKKSMLKELNGVCLELADKLYDEAVPESGVVEAIVSENNREDTLPSKEQARSRDGDDEVVLLQKKVLELTNALANAEVLATEQARSKDVDNEVSLLQDRVRELTDALATTEDEAREREGDLEDQLQQLQSQLSSKNDAAHAEEVRRLKDEKEKAVKEIQQQLEKERAFFQERVEKGKKSKQELIGKLDATQHELEKNKAQFADLEKKSIFMSKKEMKAKLKSSSTLIQSLQKENGQLAMELQAVQQNLSERDASDKVKQAELEQKARELEKMVEEVANLKTERDAANKEKEAELESLSSSLTEKALELEKMVEEVSNLKHHLSLSEKKGSADRVALKVNKSKLVEECEQLKAQLAASGKARDDLHAQVEEHEKELSRRQTLLNDVKKRNYSLQEMIDELNETLERSGSEASEQVGFLERKLQIMKEELEETRSTSAQHHEDAKRLKEEQQKMQGQLAKVTKELGENRVSILEKEKLSSDNEFLDERVGELTESLAKAEADAKEREGFLEKKLQILKMELDETRSASDMRQDEIQRLKQENQNILEGADSKYRGFKEQLSAKEDEVRLLKKQAEDERISLKEQAEKEKTLKMGLVHKLEATKVEHTASLSRRQELLDDMDKHNALLKQRVSELTDCLAKAEDAAREREDALEEKLQQMGVELEEAKITYNQKCVSQVEDLKRVEAEKEAALHKMRQQMEVESASFHERIEREERSKVEVMDELGATEKHNALLKQRVSELTGCLAKAEDAAREREDALEEKLQQMGVELEEAKITYNQKCVSQVEDLKRVEAEKEAALHKMRQQMEVESASFHERIEREERSKVEVMDELGATEKHNALLKQRVSELTGCLAKAEDAAREREDALEEKLQQMGVELEEAKITYNQKCVSQVEDLKRVEAEKEAALHKMRQKMEVERASLNERIEREERSKVEVMDELGATEKHNALLKQRVSELTDCLAKAEDAAREREDALEEKLQQMGVELEEAKITYNQKCVSQVEDLKRVEAEKEAALHKMRQKMEVERASLNERIEREERSKVEVMDELGATEKHNALLKQRVSELTQCLAKAEDDAREREDALEEKLQLMGVELEEAKITYNQKSVSHMEDLKRVEAEKEAALLEMRQQIEAERVSFNERIEIEERSKAGVMDELDAAKDDLIQSEASNTDLESRLEDMQKTMETKICELTTTLEKAYDDAREREDALQEELCLLGKQINEAKVTAHQNDTAHQNEIERIDGEKRVLLNDNTKLQEQLESLMNQIEMGENTKNDLQGRVEALNRARSFHEKSLSRRQELLDEMEARNKTLKQRVAELTDCLAKSEDDAREREDALEDKLQQMGVEFEEAKSTFDKETVAHTDVVHRLEEEKEVLASQLCSLGHEMDDLKEQISVLKSTNIDVESQLDQVKASNAESEDHVKELSEKLDNANQDAARSKALCADLKSKLEAAERLLDESDAEINTLSYDCDCLEKQVENLNAQLESQQEVISGHEAKIEVLRNEITLIKNEKESLSEDLESHMAKVLLSEDEKSDLLVRIGSSVADLKTAEAEKLRLVSERDSFKSTADERLTLLQQLEGKTQIRQSELLESLTAKEFEITSLTSQREELQSNLDELGCRFSQLQNQSKKDSESFKNRHDQLLNEISTLNAQNEKYTTQIKALEANIGRIKAQLIKEKETHEKTERQLLMDIRNSQNTISGAKLKHVHVENEVQSLKSQLNARESEISKLVDENERLVTELRIALDKADAGMKESAKAQNEHAIAVKELETGVERERAICFDLTSRLETLSSAMDVKQEEVNSLKNELSCAKESMRLLQSEEKMSKSTLESKLIDTRSQFEAERQSLKECISRLEADARESQQNLLAEKTSSIETEAHLNSQVEIIKAELSNAKRTEEDLREQLNDLSARLEDKKYEIEELNSDVLSEKEDRRQELYEMKCLYEKKIQELMSSSLDIETEKSILENKVERLGQDIVVSREKEYSLLNRIQNLEQLLQRQNDELLKVSGDLSSSKAEHENALSEMEKTYAWNVEELKELHDTERSELLQQMAVISDELRQCQEELNEQRATQEHDKLMLGNDKNMIDQLRSKLEEGIDLNDSLSTNLKEREKTIEVLRQNLTLKEESLLAADRKYKAKIEEVRSSHATEKQHLVDEIEKFSLELDWSLDQIDKRQAIIDSQRLSLNDENNELVRELSRANDTEMKLRKLLHESQMEVQQLSIEFAAMRSDVVLVIDEARNTSDETLQQTAQSFKATTAKWVAEKVSYEDRINLLTEDVHKLSKRDEHLNSQVEKLQSILEERDQAVEELTAGLTLAQDGLIAARVETDRARVLDSQVQKLQSTLESRDQNIEDLSIQFTSAKEELCAAVEETERVRENLECVMNQLEVMVETNAGLQEEISKLENAKQLIQSLYDAEKGDLQSEIDSLLADGSDKLLSVTSELDTMILANDKLQEEIGKLESQKQLNQDTFDAEKVELLSKIDALVNDLTAAQNELGQTRANIDRIEQDRDTKVETALNDLGDMALKNELLQDEIANLKSDLQASHQSLEAEKIDLQSKIDSLVNDLAAAQDELGQTRANIDRIERDRDTKVETVLDDLGDMKLKNELLLDEIANLKSDLQASHHSFDTQRGNYESNIASLSTELKSSSERFEMEKESFKTEWRHFQLLLKHLVDSIEGKVDANEFNSSSDQEDLPDIASQLGTLIELVGKKEESILQLKSQVESLEFDLKDARIVRDRLLHHNQIMDEDLETSRFLSEIEEAKVKVIGMDRRLMSEKNKRKELETQISAEGKNLAMIKEELAKKESIIDELEETVRLKLVEIEKLESRLCKNDDLREKLEGKYEEAKSELESYHNLATELKQTIIDKNQDIESKEGRIMDLQFQVDDLASQVDGWRASLEGLTGEAGGWKAALHDLKHDFQDDEFPNDTSEILSTSTSSDRHDELSKEIAKLEEKMLLIDEDHRQQSSMHKSIVDGLEARCDMLSEENAEAQSYISSLEDTKVRLQGKIDLLKKDCDVQRRRLSELESVFNIMKQQKSVSETLCDEVLSGLRKLTGVAIMYSSRLEGFSDEISAPSSWSVNIEYISRFIECALKLNQKYLLDIQRLETTVESRQSGGVQVVAEAITPKAKGSGSGARSQESIIMPQHLDMINDIKNMKDAIKNVMASPELTPMKSKQSSNSDEDGDLYSDLLAAYDQLENLSKKIETYQEEQAQWNEKESTLQSRIEQLEEEKLHLESTSKAVLPSVSEGVDDTKLKEAGAMMISNVIKRRENARKEQAFRNWASQTQTSKQMNIVKGMARELNSTREKVQMLKSNLDMDTR